MDIQHKLIAGFINEIATNWRSHDFEQLLQSVNNEIITQAYTDALEIIEAQHNLLNGTVVSEFLTFDFERNLRFASKVPDGTITTTSALEDTEKLNLFSTLLGIESKSIAFCEVSGNSMLNAGITDGDIVIVNQTDNANDGDIVVAKVIDKYYVKKYKIIDNNIWLYSENPEYAPVRIPNTTDFTIFGLVCNVVKSIHK
ncbi:MAG: hypothetical protein LBO69_02420 [Ignavibacteria bacterium]|jgi:hypothetical protein|nr:hypothetical protein [Ignavibacteria bacterium]